MKTEVVFIHPSADVSDRAELGSGVKVWNNAQIRENARIGDGVIVSKNVYIDFGVRIGTNSKIQNNVSVFHGVTIEDGVFVGPHVCFTNDKIPRAVDKRGASKGAGDWTVSPTVVRTGASIGAHSVILPGIEIGSYAMIGAGSVVTKDVPPHALVVGNPARVVGIVCRCGCRATADEGDGGRAYRCVSCGEVVEIAM